MDELVYKCNICGRIKERYKWHRFIGVCFYDDSARLPDGLKAGDFQLSTESQHVSTVNTHICLRCAKLLYKELGSLEKMQKILSDYTVPDDTMKDAL